MAYDEEAVRDYHKQLTTLKIRFPKCDLTGTDYLSLIKDQAARKGFTTRQKGDDGEPVEVGNVNAYVLDLIEKDLGIIMTKSVKAAKKAVDGK